MAQSFGSRWKRAVLALVLLFVGSLATSCYMLPGQIHKLSHEPRYIPAVAVACWRFETLNVLTLRQRLLWRYSLLLERNGSNLAVHFEPRHPNTFTDEKTERPRRAWETHVLVNPRTFKVVRWYLSPD
jgi:hypothetical protein